MTDLLHPPVPAELISLPPAVSRPTAAVFGTLSRLRGRRAMHPEGVVVTATLAVPARGDLPRRWREMDGATGIVRFSKSVGLPRGWPDVLGIALRFGTQDLLLASAGGAPAVQHLLRPAGAFDGAVFSSLLPHQVGARADIVQATVAGLPTADEPLDAVRAGAGATVTLTAVSLLGRRRALGVVRLGGEVTDPAARHVRFDPWRTGGDLTPAGPLQRWRAAAYAASRRAVDR